MSHNTSTLGTPTYLHIHCKSTLPSVLQYNTTYTLSLILINELDAYNSHAILQYSTEPLIVQCTLLSTTHQKHNNVITISQRTKPVFNINTGTVTIDIVIHDWGVGRQLSHIRSDQYRLIVGVRQHKCSSIIIPYCTNPLTLTNNKSAIKQTNAYTTEYITHAISINHDDSTDVMLMSEISGSYIGTRIWDSSLLLIKYIQQYNVITNTLWSNNSTDIIAFWLNKSIIELGSGTGTVGIYIYHILSLYCMKQHNVQRTHITVTDLAECMELLQYNVQQNQQLYSNNNNVQIDAQQYSFGNMDDYNALHCKQYDIIVCSDLVYNNEFFDVLLDTLKLLSHDNTGILMSYRPRVTADIHDKVFFDALTDQGYITYILQKFNNVYILLISKVALTNINTTDCQLPFQ